MDQFKKKTLELKKTLLRIHVDCKKKENISDSDQIVFTIKNLARKYYPLLDAKIQELSILASDINNNEYEAQKCYFRKEVYPLFVNDSSVLNKHICSKPLGYSGDYIVANHFYENAYPGIDLIGKFFDRFTIESPLARAHMNRRKFLSSAIRKICSKRSNVKNSVASFACGPAQEVFDVLDAKVQNVKFNLVDGEKDVESFIKNKLMSYKENKIEINFLHHNILNLVRKNVVLDIGEQDFIYCAGFFDYLHDRTCKQIIKYMLCYLKKNGKLLIVNVSKDDVHNVYLNMIGEWHLYHRNSKELGGLTEGIQEVNYRKVFTDPFNSRNLYLVIKKN